MTPLEHLWNGWRSTYVQSGGAAGGVHPDDTRSVFSRILESGLDDVEAHIVHRGELVFVIMNAFPYSVGHMLILPLREVGELDQLSAGEQHELWSTVTDAVRVLQVAMKPGGVNVGLNLGEPAGGSVRQHLHVHVVPRWNGDANFMTATANTRTLPEPLTDTAAKLRAAWPSTT